MGRVVTRRGTNPPLQGTSPPAVTNLPIHGLGAELNDIKLSKTIKAHTYSVVRFDASKIRMFDACS